MAVKLDTQIGRIRFKNPVLVASGTFGYAKEFERLMDLRKLGGIVTKTLTLKPRLGNPPQRIVETPSGMLNAIGLQNVGAERFIAEKMPYLRKLGVPVVASVMGYSIEEFKAVVSALDPVAGIDGFEMNLSCPNVSYGTKKEGRETDSRLGSATKASADPSVPSEPRMFAHDERLIEEVVAAVRGVTTKTLIAKLGPDVSDIARMGLAAERAGADAVSLVNTFRAMVIDVRTRRPVLANKTGGLSGPCIRPMAVRMVWEAKKKLRVPVIGMGGIMHAHDALEFMIAGASAVQIGTANFTNPSASIDILEGIRQYMKEQQIKDLKRLIGSIQE